MESRVRAVERAKSRIIMVLTHFPHDVRRQVYENADSNIAKLRTGEIILTVWFRHIEQAQAFLKIVKKDSSAPYGSTHGLLYKVSFPYMITLSQRDSINP